MEGQTQNINDLMEQNQVMREALEEISKMVQDHGEEVTIWDLISIAQQAIDEVDSDD